MKLKEHQLVYEKYSGDFILSFEMGGVRSIKITSGSQCLGLCPFHDDKNPSFSFNYENGLWQCFAGCGSGNIYHFYSKVLNICSVTEFKKLIETMNRNWHL